MKKLRLSFLTSVTIATLFSGASHAAAFQFYELGTPINGTAGVGQAVTDDASISYFNPAGMALLPSSEIMVGGQLLIPQIRFSPNSANTIPGNSGGGAGLLTPGLGMFYVYNLNPGWKLGVSFTQPYGGALDYNDNFVGRYNVQQSTFFVLDLNPAIAYEVNQYVSLGAGVTLEYAYLNQTTALPLVGTALNGQTTVKAANYAPGFNLGATLTPAPGTKLGLAFRSQIVHHLNGNADFLNIPTTPAVNTRMVMPANVILSGSQAMNDQFSLLGELGWANWSSMRDTVLNVTGYTLTTPMNWNDTYRLGLGAQYRFTSPWMVHAGISYDSSPTTSSKRLPVLPMDRQIRAGIGLEYTYIQAITVAASYEYINFGTASINNTTAVGTLAGSYSSNYANVLQLSLNVKV